MSIKPTEITSWINPSTFLEAVATASAKELRDLLAKMAIVGEHDYVYSASPERGWQEGKLHWFPVGRELGNAGRIKLAGAPENPIAERTINGMEGLIELERQRELSRDKNSPPPTSPRDAVKRYFDLPALEMLPGSADLIRGQKPYDHAREMARRLRVRLQRTTRPVEYAIIIEDDGIGQAPGRVHSTLLSLGASDKPDKKYLIGEYGQGGSSAYAACELSWVISRRAPDLLDGDDDGVGWTIIKRIMRPVRGAYWAYLAAHPDGRVPKLPVTAADKIGLPHGTRIGHVNYNFGKSEPARTLFQSLNHLLFSPVLPFELYTGPTSGPKKRRPDPMFGNAYRLSRIAVKSKKKADEKERVHDKVFSVVEVYKKREIL